MSTKATKTKSTKTKAATPKKATRKTKKEVDPNKPKKPITAFILYSNDNRQRVKDQNPGIAFGEIQKVMGQDWKAAKPATIKKYEDLANKDKVRYEKQMKDYVPDAKYAKSKRKKDPNAPKHPIVAYMAFATARQKVIKAQNPGMSQQDVLAQCGAEWAGRSGSLTDAERQKYINMAKKDRVRYDAEMEKYEASKPKSSKGN